MRKLLIFIAIAFWILSFGFNPKIFASTNRIIINELMPNPIGVDSDFEWLELYNDSENDINLNGYKLDGQTFGNVTIEAQDFLIVARNPSKLLTIYPTLINVASLNISMTNTSDSVSFYDNSNNLIDSVSYSSVSEGKSFERKGPLDSIDCTTLVQNTSGDTIEAENLNLDPNCFDQSKPEEIVEVNQILFSLNNDEWFNSIEVTGTTTLYLAYELSSDVNVLSETWKLYDGTIITSPYELENYVDKPITLELTLENGQILTKESEILNIYEAIEPNTLQISEVYPSPEANESEWIEVYNYGDFAINLQKFYFKDKAENSITIDNELTIAPKKYITIDASNLNNSDEEISLFNSQNERIDFVNYGNILKTTSIGRKLEGNFLIPQYTDINTPINLLPTAFPTPNEVNEFENSENVGNQVSFGTIQEAKGKNINDTIYIEGVINVDKDLFGDTIFYLQDKTGGIRVDLSNSVGFEPKLFQKLRLKGKLDLTNNGYEINIEKDTDIRTTDEIGNSLGNENLEPLLLSSNDFAQYEGMLIKTSGTIVNNYSASFDLDTEIGIIRASILSSTDINIPSKSKGDHVEVFGILSKYGDIYRILPRYDSDLTITEQEILPTVKSVKTTKTSGAKVKSASSTKSNKAQSAKVAATDQKGNLSYNLLDDSALMDISEPVLDKKYYIAGIIAIVLLSTALIFFNRKKNLKSYLKDTFIKLNTKADNSFVKKLKNP